MTTLTTYTLQVLGPGQRLYRSGWKMKDPIDGLGMFALTDSDKRVLSNLPAMIEAAEEDFSDLLPEGYTVKIREWNAP